MKIHIAKAFTWLDLWNKIIYMRGYKHGTRKSSRTCDSCFVTFEYYISKEPKFCSRTCADRAKKRLPGRKHSKETIEKLRLASLNNPKVMATTFKKNHNFWNHPNVIKNWYKKGTVPSNYANGKERTLYQKIKDDSRYKRWRKAVLDRDNYTCVDCGIRDIKLHCHHIKKSTEFINNAYDVDNGVALCQPCHVRRHKT